MVISRLQKRRKGSLEHSGKTRLPRRKELNVPEALCAAGWVSVTSFSMARKEERKEGREGGRQEGRKEGET